MKTRTVTWGEHLHVVVSRSPGGLKGAWQHINDLLGPTIGSRATFTGLYRVDNIEQMDDVDRYRAWVLLTAVKEEPSEWGLSDDVVPQAIGSIRLARALTTPGATRGYLLTSAA